MIMNKTLKFRVWDKKLSKFVVPTINDEKIEGFIPFVNKNGELVSENDRFILQQFIGLRDHDNINIFEGDIILLSKKEFKTCFPLVVRYFEPAARYYLHRNLDRINYMSDFDKSFENVMGEDWLVIGNIMENPELIDNK